MVIERINYYDEELGHRWFRFGAGRSGRRSESTRRS